MTDWWAFALFATVIAGMALSAFAVDVIEKKKWRQSNGIVQLRRKSD